MLSGTQRSRTRWIVRMLTDLVDLFFSLLRFGLWEVFLKRVSRGHFYRGNVFVKFVAGIRVVLNP
jgi:hypothetical protein